VASNDRITVVHLVRAFNGIECFREFLDSYRSAPPGIPCDLLLVMKGFSSSEETTPYRSLVEELPHRVIAVPDIGFDLGAYFTATASIDSGRLCFLNSFSRILVPGWLAKFDAAFQGPGVGLVGATATWGSGLSYALYRLRLPSAYHAVFPDRRNVWEQFRSIDRDVSGREPANLLRRRLRILISLRDIGRQIAWFRTFPGPFIRTNAFMIEASTLRRLHFPPVRRKVDAFRIESGRRCLTCQVQALGLRTLVIDRHGAAYEPERWPASRTFWQGDQEGLLVADNVTRVYQDGDANRRSMLARLAWGPTAEPSPALESLQPDQPGPRPVTE
jgi:hypothetical protein